MEANDFKPGERVACISIGSRPYLGTVVANVNRDAFWSRLVKITPDDVDCFTWSEPRNVMKLKPKPTNYGC